ncbi:hypothetical protein BN8_04993 [Fibrisoma limi BUZ 3]|uniref:Uncharacterized protein n=1 Tax=Fibrisoma limi BUZ 3 TaxID=1185876 RepID=I2GP85_9BACT|nr:hypothetical protein BN8_04993 [Fibrisoma limi BUZ 3]
MPARYGFFAMVLSVVYVFGLISPGMDSPGRLTGTLDSLYGF